MAPSLLSQLFSPKQRRHHRATCRRAPAVFLERLGCDQLEARIVLDGDSLPSPVPAEIRDLPGNTLFLGDDFTAIAHAQFGDFTYSVSSEGVAITGYTGSGGEVVIPARIDGLWVTSIADRAFLDNQHITSVLIPDTVLDIGRYAFGRCPNLVNAHIPNSVTSLGYGAFDQCLGLLSITIPGSIARIGDQAFMGCSSLARAEMLGGVQAIGDRTFSGCSRLTQVTIPASVTSIGVRAFFDCYRLASINIPNGVTRIGPLAFGNCGLTTVLIPSSVTAMSNAFSGCRSLTTLEVEPANPSFSAFRGVVFNKSGSELVAFPGGFNGLYAIPTSVTSIGPNAFENCSGLTSVAIPDSVRVIGDSAFRGCFKLATVTIPESVTTIDDHAFLDCKSLEDITIPRTVTKIGGLSFGYCSSLKRVTIPPRVAGIGPLAFIGCSKLEAIDVAVANASFSSIDGVLYNKAGSELLEYPGGRFGNYTIPDSVQQIGAYAFMGHIGLTGVTIPGGVVIGGLAFNGCSNLRSVYFLGNAPPNFAYGFSRTPSTVYFRQGINGWGATFESRPTASFQAFDVPAGQQVLSSPLLGISRILKQGPGTLVLDGASSHTGGTVIEAGQVIVRSPAALGSGLLEIHGTAKVAIQSDHRSLALTSLKMATTASLDLGTNRLEIAAAGFELQQVRGMLIAGRNGGNWDGTAGVTSSAAEPGSNRTIGYRVTDGTLEIAFAAAGDTNLDGIIGVQDLIAITAGGKFNTGEAAGWDQGDVNYDGVVNALDLVGMVSTGLYGKGTYIPAIQPAIADVDLSAVEVSVDGPATVQSDASEIAPLDARLLFTALAIENEAVAGTTAGKKRLG